MQAGATCCLPNPRRSFKVEIMELFDIQPSLSPRLKWLERHNLVVEDNGPQFKPGDQDEGGWTLYRYVAHHVSQAAPFADHLTGWGDTEIEACENLGRKLGLTHWSLS